jgi:hypothetical protein
MFQDLAQELAKVATLLEQAAELVKTAGKYDHIDFSIPEGVQKAAIRGLELRKKFGRGGTHVGMGTARKLAKGGKISPQKVRHISKYFARHAGDNLHKTGRDGDPPSNGYIAWLLWGGDAGWRWSKKLVRQINKANET